MSCSDLKMTHVSADPSFTFYAEYGTAEMEMTDCLTGATIHLLGQLGKPTLLGKKATGNNIVTHPQSNYLHL